MPRAFEDAAGGASSTLQDIPPALVDKVESNITYIDNSLRELDVLPATIITDTTAKINTLETTIKEVVDHPLNEMDTLAENAKDAAYDVPNVIAKAIRDTQNMGVGEGTSLTEGIKVVFDTATKSLSKGVTNSVSDVSDYIYELIHWITLPLTTWLGETAQKIDDNIEKLLAGYQPIIDKIKIVMDFIGEVSDFMFEELVNLLKGALEWKEEDLPGIIETAFSTLQKISMEMAARRG